MAQWNYLEDDEWQLVDLCASCYNSSLREQSLSIFHFKNKIFQISQDLKRLNTNYKASHQINSFKSPELKRSAKKTTTLTIQEEEQEEEEEEEEEDVYDDDDDDDDDDRSGKGKGKGLAEPDGSVEPELEIFSINDIYHQILSFQNLKENSSSNSSPRTITMGMTLNNNTQLSTSTSISGTGPGSGSSFTCNCNLDIQNNLSTLNPSKALTIIRTHFIHLDSTLISTLESLEKDKQKLSNNLASLRQRINFFSKLNKQAHSPSPRDLIQPFTFNHKHISNQYHNYNTQAHSPHQNINKIDNKNNYAFSSRELELKAKESFEELNDSWDMVNQAMINCNNTLASLSNQNKNIKKRMSDYHLVLQRLQGKCVNEGDNTSSILDIQDQNIHVPVDGEKEKDRGPDNGVGVGVGGVGKVLTSIPLVIDLIPIHFKSNITAHHKPHAHTNKANQCTNFSHNGPSLSPKAALSLMLEDFLRKESLMKEQQKCLILECNNLSRSVTGMRRRVSRMDTLVRSGLPIKEFTDKFNIPLGKTPTKHFTQPIPISTFPLYDQENDPEISGELENEIIEPSPIPSPSK